jgi:tRNA(Ile)-lysidine synthase
VSARIRKRDDAGDASLLGCVAAALMAAGLQSGRLVLGLSGGMDSMVLLDLLSALRADHSFDLHALHVDHQLSPHAQEWSAACAQRCHDYRVPFQAVRVEIQRDSPEGLEAAARRARYAVYAMQDANAVVLAHHLDDQAETLLLQLLRGAGPRGLAAMPAVRPIAGTGRLLLLRPLLEVEREHIERYARRRALSWIEDESNADPQHDRNYLRQEVLPRLSARFPGYRQTWLRASRNFADLSEIADAQALADASGALRSGGLLLARLRELSAARAANLLRWYFVQEGLPVPRRDQLGELLRQFAHGRSDAQPNMRLGEARVYRHRGLLRIAPAVAATAQRWRARWCGEPEVLLPAGLGRVQFQRLTGAGLAATQLAGKALVLRARGGGERMKLVANRPTRTLKNLLQEAGIPQWQRDLLPLLEWDGQVVWSAQVGIDCRFSAAADQPGILPVWLPG